MFLLIVEFTKEKAVGVIPKSWLKGGNSCSPSCSWPPYNKSRLWCAVRTGEQPNKSWEDRNIRILHETGDLLSKHQKYSPVSQVSQRAAEGASLNVKTQRRNKKGNLNHSLSSSDGFDKDAFYNMPATKCRHVIRRRLPSLSIIKTASTTDRQLQRQRNRRKLPCLPQQTETNKTKSSLTNNSRTHRTSSTLSDGSSTPKTHSTHPTLSATHTGGFFDSASCDGTTDIAATYSANPAPNKDIESLCVRLLVELKDMINENNKLLTRISDQLNSALGAQPRCETVHHLDTTVFHWSKKG